MSTGAATAQQSWAFKPAAARLRIRLRHANTRGELGFGGVLPTGSFRPRT